jgi:hypothetical protein
LSAVSIASRRPGGRLSPRAVNLILQRIGRWHDAEHSDPARWVSPLRPHEYADLFVMPTFGRKAGRTGLIAA